MGRRGPELSPQMRARICELRSLGWSYDDDDDDINLRPRDLPKGINPPLPVPIGIKSPNVS